MTLVLFTSLVSLISSLGVDEAINKVIFQSVYNICYHDIQLIFNLLYLLNVHQPHDFKRETLVTWNSIWLIDLSFHDDFLVDTGSLMSRIHTY